MIQEVATLKIDPSRAGDFEEAVSRARPLFLEAQGCHGVRLERVIEHPGTYLLVVNWESIEAHTETFRSSKNFEKWRSVAGPFFIEQPVVVHTCIVSPAASL